MPGKKSGLGKGLDSLIPNKKNDISDSKVEKKQEKENDSPKSGEIMVRINEVEPNRDQPRKDFDEDALMELADSIRQFGILQPLLVQKKKNYYEIIAGERRWRAAKLAGLKEVPVVIREMTDQEIVEISLIENIQRENLNPIEEAMAYDSILKSSNITQDELAKKFGKSRSYITNSLGLLRLPDDTKKYVEDNKLSMSHARALSKLDDTEQINRLANKIVNENLNVRAIENITRDIHEQEIKKETDENTLFEFKQYDTLNTNHIYEDAMREKFGIKVKITGKKIEIPYSSQLELQRILELMDVKIEG